jgi:hypothetical protein
VGNFILKGVTFGHFHISLTYRSIVHQCYFLYRNRSNGQQQRRFCYPSLRKRILVFLPQGTPLQQASFRTNCCGRECFPRRFMLLTSPSLVYHVFLWRPVHSHGSSFHSQRHIFGRILCLLDRASCSVCRTYCRERSCQTRVISPKVVSHHLEATICQQERELGQREKATEPFFGRNIPWQVGGRCRDNATC